MFCSVLRNTGRNRAFPIKSSLRRYATAQPPKLAVPAPRPSAAPARPQQSANTAPQRGTLEQIGRLRKIELAEALYNNHIFDLYKAPQRLTWFRLQNWIVAALSLAAVTVYQTQKLLDFDEARKTGLPKAVTVAFYITAFFLAAVGGGCLYRVGGQVHRVRLIKEMDHVFLQVSTRSHIPFVKHRDLIRPSDLQLDSRFKQWRETPQWMLDHQLDESSPSATTISVIQGTGKAISRFFHTLFTSARQFFLQDGVIDIEVLKNEKPLDYKLDLSGMFEHDNNSRVVLFDLATFKDNKASG